jgi:IS5 family transposase
MTGEGDLFRARLDQIVNMKHELVQLGGKIDWDWIDRQIAPFYSDKGPARNRDQVRHRAPSA